MKGVKKSLLFLPILLLFLSGCNIAVLNPAGPVAQTQYELIIFSIIMMSFILVGVFIAFGYILYKFRATPKNRDYEPPEIEGSKKMEIIWTVIPVIIVVILAIPTIQAIYELKESTEPEQEPVVIKVTSAQWKWIFQYPEQGIETVNYAYIPTDVPIKIILTSAGAMNSFWVPQLAGQEYTMTGMKTLLWLEASEPGTYRGKGSNFTGKKFFKMRFKVTAAKRDKFQNWVEKIQSTKPKQSKDELIQLLQPGVVGKMAFSSYPKDFDIVAKVKEGELQNESGSD